MKVAVVGAGAVGLSTAAALVRSGVDVTCFERAGTVLGERSAGSSRIFRLAHSAPDLVRYALQARDEFTRWSDESGRPMVDACGCVVSGAQVDVRAAAMAAAGAPHEIVDGGSLRIPARRRPARALVDPSGGVVDVHAVRAFLLERAGATVVHEPVDAVTASGVSTPAGDHPADAVVVAAGADTPGLVARCSPDPAGPAGRRSPGIDLPSGLEHHVRFTFAVRDAPWSSWIDHPADGLPTYQHRTGPGRWSVGATVDPALVAWDNGRDAATAASRAEVTAYARAHLDVDPEVVDDLYCTHTPAGGDGITFRRNGSVLAVHGENLMKFVPVLGATLAAAAVDGSTPPDLG